jgi:hypothetical protein
VSQALLAITLGSVDVFVKSFSVVHGTYMPQFYIFNLMPEGFYDFFTLCFIEYKRIHTGDEIMKKFLPLLLLTVFLVISPGCGSLLPSINTFQASPFYVALIAGLFY